MIYELTNLLSWLRFLLDSLTVTLTVLLIWFISSVSSICSTVVFPPLWNSHHVVVSISIDFPSNSKGVASSHFAAYDYSRIDCDGLCDHFRDVPWDDIFKLGASAVAAEFCECFQVGVDVYFPHRIYHVKPHPFPWFQLLVLQHNPGANTGFQYRMSKVVARFRDTKIAKRLAPHLVGGEENLWFLYALKCPIAGLILPEKTWEGIKTVFFKIKVTTYISEFLDLGAEITAQ